MMLKRYLSQTTIGLMFISTLSFTLEAHSANERASMAQLSEQVEERAAEVKRLKEEYEFTRYKRHSTEDKLYQSERDLITKQDKINRGQAKENLTEQEANALRNEQKRLELLEIGITSQQAALERLREKEESLLSKIEKSEASYTNARASLAKRETAYRKNLEREISKLTQQVQRLNEQNQQLELALEDAVLKAESAEADARILAEQNEELLAFAESQQALADEADGADQAQEPDISQMVLPGELPIYREARPSDIVLRSRTLDEKYPMREISKNVFEAEVVISPGTDRAYFDVVERRYRGRFPDLKQDTTYVFTLDRNNSESPSMDVRRKDSEQVVSNNDAPL